MLINNQRESLIKTFFKSSSFLASFLLSLLILLNNQSIIASTQFENKQQIDILDYENISTQNLDSATDFGTNGTISNNQFETNPDLITTIGSQEGLALNHYGDNPPDTTNLGDWWDDDGDSSTLPNWPYRNCFEVDYSSGVSNLTEYQLYLDFDTQSLISASQMQSQGQDIRVADSTGNLIDHYIADDINTASTRVWIQPDLIAAGSTTNYCLYYGNPTAPSTSNRNNVFSYTNPEDIYYVLGEDQSTALIEYGSYTDSNQTSIATTSESLDQYDIAGQGTPPTPDPITQTTSISSYGPVQATFDLNGTDSFVPASAAGTQFVYRLERNTHQFSFISPYCSTDIEIRNSADSIVNGGSITVSQGSSAFFVESGTPSFNNDDTVIIESTNNCPFLAYKSSDNSQDSLIMYPASTQWYGVGSGRLEFAALEDATDIFVYGSDNYFAEYSVSNGNPLDRGDNIDYFAPGNDGGDPAFHLVSNKPIGVNSLADSDGTEAAVFFPREEMGTRFIIPTSSQYITIAGLAGATTTVNLWNDATQCGEGVPDETIVLTQTVGNSNNPYKGFFGDEAEGLEYNAGVCIESDRPIAPYYERETGDDETNVFSWKQNRQFIHQEPTVVDAAFATGSWSLGTESTFSNRIPLTITNNSTSTIDEYNVVVDISSLTSLADLNTNAQLDGGDIRIAGPLGDGTDNYNFVLEEYQNAQDNGYLWIQTPEIGPSNSTTIFIYYNSNNVETSTSNYEETFTRRSKQISYYIVDQFAVSNNATHNIYSFIENNQIDYRGVTYSNFDTGEELASANLGPLGDRVVSQGDVLSSNGPISSSFFADGTDNLNPISFAGTKFLSVDSRYIDEYSVLAPFANSVVTFERHNGTGWVSFGSTVNLDQGIPKDIIRDINNSTSQTPVSGVRITSTTPIIVHKHANDARVPFADSQLLYPVEEAFEESTGEYILYGVGSDTVMVATENPTTNFTIYYDDATDSGNIAITATNSNAFSLTNGSDQGQGRGMKIVADGPIFASSQSDGDGSESVTYLPKKEFASEFLMTTGTQFVSIVSNDPGTLCEIYDTSDSLVTSVTMGSNSPTYVNQSELGNFVADGPLQYLAGYYMTCDDPVYAYFEQNGDDSESDISDESNFLSFPQARKKALIEPVVTDIDDVSVIEEGLFYESGFDSGGASSLPVASYEYIFDSTNFDAFWETINITEGTFDNSATEENSVTPITGTVETTTAVDCSTASYNTSITLSSGVNPIPTNLSQNNCLRINLELQTGNPAHSPVVDLIDIQYSNPDSIEDFLNDEEITLPASSTDRKTSLFKISTSNPELAGNILQLSYFGSTNNSPITKFDLNTYNPTLDSTATQFSFPSFPALPTTSVNTVAFDDTQPEIIELEYNRPGGGIANSVDLLIEILDGSNLQPILRREVRIIISP